MIEENCSYAVCAITGVQYPLQLVTPVDREVVDFASRVSTVPREAKKPGPRPKEATTTQDTQHLCRMAFSVVQRLLDTTATRYVGDNSSSSSVPSVKIPKKRVRKKPRLDNNEKKQKVSTRRYKEVPKQKVAALTPEFKQRFAETCLKSWNYITKSPDFPPYRNTYLFENHCMVVIFFAKDRSGFTCDGFTIPYEADTLGCGIINRAHLTQIGQGRAYTTAVRLFRQFVQSRSRCDGQSPSSRVAARCDGQSPSSRVADV